MARYIDDHSADSLWVNGTLDDMLPAGSVARRILTGIMSLDFARFDEGYRNDDEGRPAIDPRRLAGVWMLALLRGVTSSVEVARVCGLDLEFRWILGDAKVEKSTLCSFRTRHVEALRDLSTQILASLARSGLLPGESIAVDGSVIRAASSCHSTASRRSLTKRVARLSEVIEEKLREPDGANEEVASLESQKARLATALEEMTAMGLIKPKDRITVTEPEASKKRLKSGGFAPAHNVQVVSDAQTGVIIHTDIVQQGNDAGQLLEQVDQAEAELARVQDSLTEADDPSVGPITKVSADSAYHDTRQLVELTQERHMSTAVPARPPHRPSGVTDAYLAPEFTYDAESDTMTCPQGKALRRRKYNRDRTAISYQAQARDCAACPFKDQCCPNTKHGRSVNRSCYPDELEAIACYTQSESGQDLLRARCIASEGAFARLIDRLHWRRCRTWGAAGARAEALWRQLTHNLMIATGHWQPIIPAET